MTGFNSSRLPQTTFAVVFCLIVIVCGCNRKSVDTIVNIDAKTIESSSDVQFAASDWPWWRGPHQDGIALENSVPVVLDESKNLRWKIPLSGEGHASPIVVGDKVFLATANPSSESMSLVCFRATDGEELWETLLHQGKFMHMHNKNTQASATPASDGSKVYTAFMFADGIQVSAVDLDGNIVWQQQAGPFTSRHGYGSSPVLYKSLVIVNGDNHGSGFLAALDRETGQIAWRIKRNNEASFATPVIADLYGKPQLLLSGAKQMCSYNPANGSLNWQSAGPASTTANTVAWNDELVFASGGYPQQSVMAIKADGSKQVVWQKDFKAYVPSPLLVGDKLIVTQDTGIVHCLTASTGEELWKQRLDGECSGSPIAIGDTIIQATETGNVYSYKFDPAYEAISEIKLDGRILSTPVASGHGLFIRTSTHLYCFGN